MAPDFSRALLQVLSAMPSMRQPECSLKVIDREVRMGVYMCPGSASTGAGSHVLLLAVVGRRYLYLSEWRRGGLLAVILRTFCTSCGWTLPWAFARRPTFLVTS